MALNITIENSQAIRPSIFQNVLQSLIPANMYVVSFIPESIPDSAHKRKLYHRDTKGSHFTIHIKELIQCTSLKVWAMAQMWRWATVA